MTTMDATSINRLMRRRTTALAIVLALAGAVLVHHLPAEHREMGGAMVLCLGVLSVVAVAVVRLARGQLPRLRAVPRR